MNAPRPTLHIAGMLKALDAHGVNYVVIGGVAGRAHGDPTLTYDLDITPEPSAENLTRLSGALAEMEVGLRVPDLDEPIAFQFDAQSIGRFTTLATRGPLGDLDIVLRPDGIPGGYEQLAAKALREPAYGLTIAIADLDDLIAARRAAAAITGLDHYTVGADRLADLQARRQPAAEPDRDAADVGRARRASFPESSPGSTSEPPGPSDRPPTDRPQSRGPDLER